MKTEQQIREWTKSHTVHKNDAHAITGFLLGKGICKYDITFNIGANKECFDDFMLWFETTESKFKEAVPNNEINAFKNYLLSKYKFKAGDWVRFNGYCECYCVNIVNQLCSVKSGEIVQLRNLMGLSSFNFNGNTFIVPITYLEPAIPKEGEFWILKTKGAYIFNNYINKVCDDRFYGISINGESDDLNDGYILKSDIVESRPSTEQEKNQLIKAVEEKYNNTWNGKEWLDIKPVFKKGDYIYGTDGKTRWAIRIYGTECVLYSHIGLILQCHNDSGYLNNAIFATLEQCKMMNDELAKKGKYFNMETLELEDIIKVGDMVICYDKNNKENIRIGILHKIHNDRPFKYKIKESSFLWECVIKFKSEEQYRELIMNSFN